MSERYFHGIKQNGMALVVVLLISLVLSLLAVNLMSVVFMQFNMTAAYVQHEQSIRVVDRAMQKLLQKIQTEQAPQTSTKLINDLRLRQDDFWREFGRTMLILDTQVVYLIESLQVEPCLQGRKSPIPGVTFYRVTLRASAPASNDYAPVIYLQSTVAKATPMPQSCHSQPETIRLINLGLLSWHLLA